jgi:hypothetical protein
MTKYPFKILFIFIVVFFLNGCFSVPEYVNYKGRDATVLHSGGMPNIFSALANNSATRLLIDGKTANIFYLKPGKYTVVAFSRSLSIFSPLSAKTTLVLDLKANREYKITSMSSVTKGRVTFLLFDITDKQKKLLREFHIKGHIG